MMVLGIVGLLVEYIYGLIPKKLQQKVFHRFSIVFGQLNGTLKVHKNLTMQKVFFL